MSENYESIAPTAFLAAYWLAQSDVPYARELFESALDIWTRAGNLYPNLDPMRTMHGLTMEARHKVGNALLKAAGTMQVLDLGAGLSPRGIQLAEADSGMQYIEVDLAPVTTVKLQVLRAIGKSSLANYHIRTGNVLDQTTFEQAVSHFDPSRPVGVFSTGLLHYLNNAERARLGGHILATLHSHGGVWVTDMPHQSSAQEAAQPPSFRSYGTGRDVSQLAFTDQAEALGFFASLGLRTVQTVHFADFIRQQPEPTSIAKLGLDREQSALEQANRGLHVLVVDDRPALTVTGAEPLHRQA